MVNQQLLDYIHQQTQMGKTKEEITSALLSAGWHANDIAAAFGNPVAPTGTPMAASTAFPRANQILKEAWAIYKNRYQTLIAVSLIPFFGFLIIGLGSAIGALILQLLHIQVGSGIIIPLIVLGIALLICIAYVSVWGTVAMIFAIKDSSQGIDWKESYKRARPYINPFFSTSLLTGLAVAGGWLLLIIPGVIFGLWFSQAPYVVIEEGLKNSAAMKRSKYYVQGRIGLIFGKLFYVGIITAGISILCSVALLIISGVTGVKTEYISWINNIFSLFITPLVTIYGYLVYKYARSTRP